MGWNSNRHHILIIFYHVCLENIYISSLNCTFFTQFSYTWRPDFGRVDVSTGVLMRRRSLAPPIFWYTYRNHYSIVVLLHINDLNIRHLYITFEYHNCKSLQIMSVLMSVLNYAVNDLSFYNSIISTGGNRAKLPSSRWRRRGRSLREVFACSRLFATTDLSQICNRVTRGHGTPCTKMIDSCHFSFSTIISERFAARRR